jgi:hypothetical protein
VNIGAAGTLVIRRSIGRLQLRAEIARWLPFATEIVLCDGREIERLLSQSFFADPRVRSGVVRFVSVLSRLPRSSPRLPLQLPSRGRWMVKILARDGRFVVGLHRRHMRAIGHLRALERLFGARATTRSWSTIAAIGKTLAGGATE